MKENLSIRLLPVVLLGFLLYGCGANVFKSQEKEDPAEDATIALERDKPDEAIDILESALDDDPDNPQYLSILSLAYAQRAGVEPLSFASNFANNAGNDDGEEMTQYDLMFALLPEPTSDTMSDINYAVSLLVSIPSDDRLPGDNFKLAMFQTAAFVMATKSLDVDADGGFSEEELANLTEADAAVLLGQIAQVATLLGESGEDDETAQAAAGKIAEFQSELDAQPGDTDEEKLRAYLEATGGGSES